MGISLAAIKEAFANLPDRRTPTLKDWERLSSAWQDELNGRIAYLQRLRDSLTGCIGCGCLSMKNCPIYNQDDKLAATGIGPVLLERAARSDLQPLTETIKYIQEQDRHQSAERDA
jgi:MerR family redox-sensitive transcriptional activator SoxR